MWEQQNELVPLLGSLKNLTTGLIWRGWGDGGRRGEVAHGDEGGGMGGGVGRWARGEMGGGAPRAVWEQQNMPTVEIPFFGLPFKNLQLV